MPHLRYWMLGCAVALVSILAWTIVAQPATAWAQTPPPDTSSPPYTQEAYIVEQLRTTWRFENDGTGRQDLYERVKVQSAAGVEAWGQLTFPYNSANERMEVRFVKVHKADGRVVTATADAVQDLSSAVEREAPVYTDTRETHVTVPGLRPGEVLEFAVATVVHTPLAPGQFWTEYDFLKKGAVLDEELQIDLPRTRSVTLKSRPGADPTITENGDRRLYRWHSSHTPVDDEKQRKQAKSSARKEPEPSAVRITTFADWDAVGRWYGSLERSQRMPTLEIRRKAKELTAGRATDVDKLQALYAYVAENFRYVSLSFGVGRYQPHAAADVLQHQYGDCKDKHTLLASLAESIGLRASAVLIHSRLKLDADFPSPSQFDHVITRVSLEGGDVWLDTTTEVAPFRLLMPSLRKKQALIVDADGPAHLEESPADSPLANSTEAEIDGTLNQSGTLSASVHLTFRGDPEMLLRIIFRRTPNADWKAMVEGMAARAGFGDHVTTWKIGEPAQTSEPFTIAYQVTAPNFVEWTKPHFDLELPLASVVTTRSAADGDSKDTSPIELGSPQHARYHVRLTLPGTYTARPPLPVSVSRDYGDYRAAYALDGRVFTAERVLNVARTELPSARRDDYTAFRRVVSGDVDQVLVVDNSAVATAGAPAELTVEELDKSAADAFAGGRFAQAVELFKRVAELEPAHRSAWNDLGRAYLELHQTDAAIDAFHKQIGINAYHASAHNNLGRAYREQRKFTEAEAAFLKQIEINPLNRSAHANLGDLYLDWRKYDAAAAELEKGVALSPKDAHLQVSLGEAYLNLGSNDRATEAFDRAVELDATPVIWNNIAYRLAKKHVDLDRAQRYAESAVAAIAAGARNLSVEHVTARDLWHVGSLAAYWDTLGWVHLAKGDVERAERLVTASWILGQHPEVGDHLGQIYERLGRRQDAIRTYALSLDVDAPDERTRERLAALAGKDRVDALVGQYRRQLLRERTITLDAKGPSGSTADFFVLLDQHAAVESVKFISGDERLRPLAGALRAAKYKLLFPDDTPAKVLRRGTVSCPSGAAQTACRFVLMTVTDAQAAQQY